MIAFGDVIRVEPGKGQISPLTRLGKRLVDLKNGSVAVELLDGQFLCVTPEGNMETRTSVGAWESFIVSGNFLKAERDPNNDGTPEVVFPFPFV